VNFEKAKLCRPFKKQALSSNCPFCRVQCGVQSEDLQSSFKKQAPGVFNLYGPATEKSLSGLPGPAIYRNLGDFFWGNATFFCALRLVAIWAIFYYKKLEN